MAEPTPRVGQNRYERKWFVLAVFLLLLLAVPAVCRYQPPLIGVSGQETHLVTDPGFFGSPLRAVQVVLETQPCTYTLHGWDEAERLYYTADCFGRERQWRCDPAQERRERVEAIPPGLTVEAGNRDEVLGRVRAAGVRPVRHEPYTRPLLLHDAGLVSPGGGYTAIITRHVYSVHDVVVLGKAK